MIINISKHLRRSLPLIVILGIFVMIVGCNRMDPPVASQSSTADFTGMWNPSPGERIIPDHDIPLVNSSYWGEQNGMSVNVVGSRAIQLIGPNGGNLRLGNHLLQIPRGALSVPVLITMSYCSGTAVGVDLWPSGLQFNVPVTLKLSYLGTQYDTQPPPTLCVVYLQPDGDSYDYVPLPSHMDQQGRFVRTDLNHFSRYIIG